MSPGQPGGHPGTLRELWRMADRAARWRLLVMLGGLAAVVAALIAG
jgi:hypothetical protein